jgi:hypothetical protein
LSSGHSRRTDRSSGVFEQGPGEHPSPC